MPIIGPMYGIVHLFVPIALIFLINHGTQSYWHSLLNKKKQKSRIEKKKKNLSYLTTQNLIQCTKSEESLSKEKKYGQF